MVISATYGYIHFTSMQFNSTAQQVFGSKRCDCKEQLDMSLRYVQQKGGGAVIYLAQEGRGIGLANKVAAYALQVCTPTVNCLATPLRGTHTL